jgi:hypothetical protein
MVVALISDGTEVHIYCIPRVTYIVEYHSVCPLVRFGTPPPHPTPHPFLQVIVSPPPWTKGGTLACWWGGVWVPIRDDTERHDQQTMYKLWAAWIIKHNNSNTVGHLNAQCCKNNILAAYMKKQLLPAWKVTPVYERRCKAYVDSILYTPQVLIALL